MIIARTTKGKGVFYAENVVGYHGIPPRDGRSGEESLDKALEDIGDPKFTKERVDRLLRIAGGYQRKVNEKVNSSMPKFSRSYWWNSTDKMKVKIGCHKKWFW